MVLAVEPSNSVAEKTTKRPERVPWISRLRSTGAALDPKATLLYVVARDHQNGPTVWTSPEVSPGVRDDFASGTVLQDRYRLIKELGQGGMGVVYLGHDQRLDRSVAVKVILSHDGAASASATMDSRLKTSFQEEARLGASLTHPAIATVFDYGFQRDNPFTVFEYIDGETLRELIERRGRLPLDEVRLIIGPLALALDFAHARGIVHRDLKPENIRSTEQRQFKILDLGLAREFSRQEDWRFAGTPAYAAPEQAAERASDGRTDQYALAVIIFELLTGRRPFESNSWLDLLEMQFSTAPPRPRSFDPDIPETVEAAILKALEKDPNLRFSTCTELAVALGCQFLTGPAPLPRILLETEVKKMGGRWKTVLYPFALRRPKTHLALAPGALWAIHRTELMRWPLAQLHDLRRRGLRGLSFRIRGVTGKDSQWFRFKSRKELRGWQEFLGSLIAADQTADAPGPNVAADVEITLDPRVEPVVLLKGRPGTRFQLLSTVEAKGPNRRRAESGLAIRGAMMGADAVVDLNAERLPGFIRTEHRASGTAVRAVDEEGRLELKSRWFAGQIDSIKLPMLFLAFLNLLGASFAPISAYLMLLTQPALSNINHEAVTLWNALPLLAFAIVMTTLTVSMIVSRWPQLVRPTAVCFLAKAVQEALATLATLASLLFLVGRSLFGATRGFADLGLPSWRGASVIQLLIVSGSLLFLIWSFSFLLLYLHLGRRAWRIDQEFRRLAASSLRSATVAPVRRTVATLAWFASIVCTLGLVGWTTWSLYQGAREALDGAKATVAEELNTLAWQQATDPDPARRIPEEALRNAEQAVKAQPDDGLLLTTRGVARYRTGDYPGAIDDLKRGITLRKFNAQDAFFLAMARARLGELEKAQKLYDQADVWTNRERPNDDELKRFREEAGALLYGMTRSASKTKPTTGGPARQKPGEAPATAK
jgi:serine/threonine protein kinase/tetratricopeptide (TPR) repeat protein